MATGDRGVTTNPLITTPSSDSDESSDEIDDREGSEECFFNNDELTAEEEVRGKGRRLFDERVGESGRPPSVSSLSSSDEDDDDESQRS